MTPEPTPPKVFISYSHDSQEHFDRILLLSDTLREWGIDCHIDQYELAPADWLRWMERRIREADFVLVVCTATYRRRFNGEEEPGKGLGVRHEGGVISVELYNRQTETAKFIPVIFSVTDNAHIPTPLQATNRHALNIEQLETDRGFENLYRHLTSQPRVIAKPIGKRRSLPPINRQEDFDEEDKVPSVANSAEETGINLKEIMPGLFAQPLNVSDVKPGSKPPKIQLATPIPIPLHQDFTEDLGNGVKLEMIAIPGGSFQMGSEDFDNTKPAHPVKLSPFHIGKFQVTQQQWQIVTGSNPSHCKDDKPIARGNLTCENCGTELIGATIVCRICAHNNAAQKVKQWRAHRSGNLYETASRPVENVSWIDSVKFCNELSIQTGREYRLPTEAEWEYACRAGSTGRYCFGDNNALLEKYAWYSKNAGDKTHPVGEKLANDWGLHDMHGNVWEWCQDWYDEDYYWESPKENPQGPPSGTYRVLRGSSFSHPKDQCCSASRGRFTPNTIYRYVGFRVVCVAKML